jgi:hypothetical protein
MMMLLYDDARYSRAQTLYIGDLGISEILAHLDYGFYLSLRREFNGSEPLLALLT